MCIEGLGYQENICWINADAENLFQPKIQTRDMKPDTHHKINNHRLLDLWMRHGRREGRSYTTSQGGRGRSGYCSPLSGKNVPRRPQTSTVFVCWPLTSPSSSVLNLLPYSSSSKINMLIFLYLLGLIKFAFTVDLKERKSAITFSKHFNNRINWHFQTRHWKKWMRNFEQCCEFALGNATCQSLRLGKRETRSTNITNTIPSREYEYATHTPQRNSRHREVDINTHSTTIYWQWKCWGYDRKKISSISSNYCLWTYTHSIANMNGYVQASGKLMNVWTYTVMEQSTNSIDCA